MFALCNACGQPYHLNQRNDLPGDDCGQVWINEEFLSLEFACNVCLTPEPQEPAGLDDILEAVEAADAAGLPEAELVHAADSGTLRHRKTASGMYLFQRGDVVAFAQGRR